VIILGRGSLARVRLRNIDRLISVWLHRFFPSPLDAIAVVKPDNVIRWHRRGLRANRRWKSRYRGERPKIDRKARAPFRRMNRENPLWRVLRIDGSPQRCAPDACAAGQELLYLAVTKIVKMELRSKWAL
jgi:hypothetical protein